MVLTLRRTFPLLILALFNEKVHSGWVDPDTKEEDRSTTSLYVEDNREYEIVFSDEFEVDGRSFKDGEDPRWTSIDKNDYTNDALHFYSSDNVKTSNGVLNITTIFKENTYMALNEKTKKKFADTKHVESAMVQGWNKFCFTGGIMEVRAKLPGEPKIGGLWPALWLLGNLARATFVGSSDYMWPWSYDVCDSENRYSQELNKCAARNHYGMKGFEGRGAPEIDLLEAMGGPPGKLPNTHIQRPYFSSSLQVAPGVSHHRPEVGSLPNKGYWYEGLEYGNVTNSSLNPFFYGVTLVHKPKEYTYQSDALSANMNINESHFDSFHDYRVEWEPPTEDEVTGKRNGGYIRWYCDGELIYAINSDVLKLTGAHIPDEPMYILLNTAVSSSWGFPKPCPFGCDCKCFECGNPDCECGLPDGFCDNIPASFEIEYVRVFQPKTPENSTSKTHTLGCSPPKRPTKLFIEGHKDRYKTKYQKEPLLPVMTGGAVCDVKNEKSCGNIDEIVRGTCVEGICECKEGFTGPKCLSSKGFDDGYSNITESSFEVKPLSMPPLLYVLLGCLILGLSTVTVMNVVKKRNEEQKVLYDHMLRSNNTYGDDHFSIPTKSTNQGYTSLNSYDPSDNPPSYQTSNIMNIGSNIGNPATNLRDSTVTYCMIDDRLIDK